MDEFYFVFYFIEPYSYISYIVIFLESLISISNSTIIIWLSFLIEYVKLIFKLNFFLENISTHKHFCSTHV